VTTLTLTAPARPRIPGRRTLWLIVRQQRGNLIGLVVLAGILCVLLTMAALKVDQANSLGLHACLAEGAGGHCATANSLLEQASQQLKNLKIALLVIPALIGAFGGAPLIAREYETGVVRYSRTQGIPPERFLAGTLLFGGAVVMALTSLVGILFNWATGLSNAGFGFTVSPNTFAAQFPALPAWSLFAYVLGVLCSRMLHRTVPAMGAALIGYGAIVYLVQEWLRPHYAALVFWTSNSPQANLFWPYQVVEAAGLFIAAILLALGCIFVPHVLQDYAWGKRAAA